MPHLPRKSAVGHHRDLSSIKRQRTTRLTKLAARAALLQRRGHEDEAYTLICNEFMALGGVYVKFLQGVLLNTPVMRRWHNPRKLAIFEGMDTVPIDIIQLLRSELGTAKVAQISRLQTEPFAAGSFGQVYYGQLQTGQPIVIKVLRPQIRDLLQHDLRLIGLFTRFFASRQYKNIDVRLVDAIKDFRRATLTETDYIQEAKFASEIYEAERNTPGIVIPRTYLELCTSQLIVQDFVGGISCAEVLEQKVTKQLDPPTYVAAKLGSDLEQQLETLGVALLLGCFNNPRIMGDPHPGNVRLLPDNKVGLIDFGIAAAAPLNRPAFYGLIKEWSHMYGGTLNIANLFEQFLRMFMNDLYRALKKLVSLSPAADITQGRQNMLKNVGGIVTEIFDDEAGAFDLEETMSQGRMMRLFNQVINRGNRLGLIMKFEDSEVLRAAQTYMSLVESLGLRGEVLAKVFASVVGQAIIDHPDLSGNSNERQLTTSQALEVVNGWLERVANRDPLLFGRLLQQFTPPTKPLIPKPESEEQRA